jgi:hypothetical protein
MATENEPLKLHGGQARQFRKLRDALEEELGYRPRKTRVFDHLLEHYDGPHLEK